MRKFLLSSAAATLAGCAMSGPPLVDMTNVDPVVYQGDLDGCEASGRGSDAVGPFVAGALIGASFGGGLGAMLGGSSPLVSVTSGEAIGTGAGAAAGAAADGAVSASAAKTAAPAAGTSETVGQCLTAKGYRVIGGGS